MQSSLQKLLVKPQEGGVDSTTLFLSLYLVVLAFFILLNSISNPDGAKAKHVTASVKDAFKATETAPTMVLDTQQTVEGNDLDLGGYFAVLKSFMEEQVQLTEVNISDRGDLMQASFPTKVFFKPKATEMRQGKNTFIEDLANNIVFKGPGAQMGVEVVIVSRRNLANGAALEIMRAGAFARRLVSYDVNPTAITLGIAPGDKEEVQFIFRPKPQATKE